MWRPVGAWGRALLLRGIAGTVHGSLPAGVVDARLVFAERGIAKAGLGSVAMLVPAAATGRQRLT